MLSHLLENDYKIEFNSHTVSLKKENSIVVEFDFEGLTTLVKNLKKELNHHIKNIKEDNEYYFEFDSEEDKEWIKTGYLQELEYCLELLKKENK